MMFNPRVFCVIVAALLVLMTGCMLSAEAPADEKAPEDASDVQDSEPSEDAGDDPGTVDDAPGDDVEHVLVRLHMPDDSGLWLEVKEYEIEIDAAEDEVETALRAWREYAEFLPPVELDLWTEGDCANVSFGTSIEDMDIEYEGLIVQSLVNSLAKIDGITSVQILIDGERSYSLAGRSYIEEPLERDESLVAREDFRPIAPADPRRGERFLEGNVRSVDVDARVVEVEVIREVGEPTTATINLADDVVVHQQVVDGENEEIGLSDLQTGAQIGIIMTADESVRAIVSLE